MPRILARLWTVLLPIALTFCGADLFADDNSTKPITAEETNALVERLTEAVRTKDLTLFESLVDEEAYITLAAKTYRVPDQIIDDLRQSSKQVKSLAIHFKKSLNLFSPIGAYDFLKAIPATDQLPQRLVFRILDINGVPHYQTWWINRSPEGNIRIFDVDESESGFSNSENLWPFLEAKQAEQSLPNLSEEQQEAVDCLKLYREGKRLISVGQHAKAVEKFDAIAPRFRDRTLIRVVRLDALQEADLNRAFREIEGLASCESCRISMAYRRMSFALKVAEVEKDTIPMVIAAVDLMEKTVDDPYLPVIKAAMMIKAGRLADAKIELRRALAAMPDSFHVRMSFVSAVLQEGEFEGAIADLDRIDSDFPGSIDKYFKYTDGYATFKKSDAGKEWLAQRRAARKLKN